MVPATSGQQLRTTKVSSPSSGKNGSVELLRFLFTSVIILFHINLDLWDQGKVAAVAGGVPIAFFHHGNLGVEFFFLVTGFLMAKSVWKDTARDRGCVSAPCHESARNMGQGLPLRENPVPDDLRRLPGRTLRFLSHKINALFPYYLPACLMTPLVRFLTGRKLDAVYFLRRIPSLFFLQRLGLGRPIIGCTWYLSSMLIALTIAYPL